VGWNKLNPVDPCLKAALASTLESLKVKNWFQAFAFKRNLTAQTGTSGKYMTTIGEDDEQRSSASETETARARSRSSAEEDSDDEVFAEAVSETTSAEDDPP
jgi:hypothetical protein